MLTHIYFKVKDEEKTAITKQINAAYIVCFFLLECERFFQLTYMVETTLILKINSSPIMAHKSLESPFVCLCVHVFPLFFSSSLFQSFARCFHDQLNSICWCLATVVDILFARARVRVYLCVFFLNIHSFVISLFLWVKWLSNTNMKCKYQKWKTHRWKTIVIK